MSSAEDKYFGAPPAKHDEECFIETDYHQSFKYSQLVGGDVFLSKKISEDNRIISVLSDGLGSGIKANVLATLTSTMAVSFISNSRDITGTAETIMRTLPVCKVRKISYSTFTIADIDNELNVRIIEYDNPPFVLLRKGKVIIPERQTHKLAYRKNKSNSLFYSEFTARPEDRIIFFTDGVSQAGIGSRQYPEGWGTENAFRYLLRLIAEKPGISARQTAEALVNKACAIDSYRPKDDITCAAIYFRKPRKLMIATGPPHLPENDTLMASIIESFEGRKIICGGSTANLIARELHRDLQTDASDRDREIPPCSIMDGIDLVTEGSVTLEKILSTLKEGTHNQILRYNAVKRAVDLLLDSDVIHFIVGTTINEAHQDPDLPVELGLRRNLIKKLAGVLEERYLKKTFIRYI